jgi:hypothetical protein
MKISSQLANNFDYCSAEIGEFFNQELFTPRPPRLRGAISKSCSQESLKIHNSNQMRKCLWVRELD